jgi:hypothetical protein
VSYSNLYGPEMLSKLSKGTSSRFGGKRWFGKGKGFSVPPGKASAASKTNFKLNRHRKFNSKAY